MFFSILGFWTSWILGGLGSRDPITVYRISVRIHRIRPTLRTPIGNSSGHFFPRRSEPRQGPSTRPLTTLQPNSHFGFLCSVAQSSADPGLQRENSDSRLSFRGSSSCFWQPSKDNSAKTDLYFCPKIEQQFGMIINPPVTISQAKIQVGFPGSLIQSSVAKGD